MYTFHSSHRKDDSCPSARKQASAYLPKLPHKGKRSRTSSDMPRHAWHFKNSCTRCDVINCREEHPSDSSNAEFGTFFHMSDIFEQHSAKNCCSFETAEVRSSRPVHSNPEAKNDFLSTFVTSMPGENLKDPLSNNLEDSPPPAVSYSLSLSLSLFVSLASANCAIERKKGPHNEP